MLSGGGPHKPAYWGETKEALARADLTIEVLAGGFSDAGGTWGPRVKLALGNGPFRRNKVDARL